MSKGPAKENENRDESLQMSSKMSSAAKKILGMKFPSVKKRKNSLMDVAKMLKLSVQPLFSFPGKAVVRYLLKLNEIILLECNQHNTSLKKIKKRKAR